MSAFDAPLTSRLALLHDALADSTEAPLSLRRAMLVAVQGADGYWARYGFVAQPPPMPVQGFGEGAVWMSRAL